MQATLTVDAAPSNPHVIYVTGERSFLGSGSLFVSIDDAKTWTERPIGLTPSEAGAYIIAIDPKNPDRVYLRTYDAASTRLLVTDDGGKTWSTKFSGGKSTDGLAATLSPDGSKIWLGTDFDGLNVASTTDFAFSRISFLQPQCLAADGTHVAAVYAGNHDAARELAGRLTAAHRDTGAARRRGRPPPASVRRAPHPASGRTSEGICRRVRKPGASILFVTIKK